MKRQGVTGRATDAEWRRQFRESDQAALAVDADAGRIVEANVAATELLGLAGHTALPPQIEPLYAAVCEAAGANRAARFSWRGRHPAGGELACVVQLVRIALPDEHLMLALLFSEHAANPVSARFQHVTEMMDALCRAETVECALAELLSRAGAGPHWVYAEAWLPDEHGDALRSVCRHRAGGVPDTLLSERHALRIDRGADLAGRAWAQGVPEWAPDLAALSDDSMIQRGAAVAAGLRSAYALPLAYEQRVVAVVVFFLTRQERRDRDLLDALTGLAGVLGMIVARRAAEQSLRERDALLNSLFSNLPCSVYRRVLHPDGRVTYPYVGGQLLRTLDIVTGAEYSDLKTALGRVHAEDRDAFVRELHRSAKEGTPLNVEYRVIDADGGVRWWRTYSMPSRIVDGCVEWDAFTLDVTNEIALRHTAEEQLRLDPVTRLPTRQEFERQLPQLASASLRHGEKVAVLAINVDRFRWINDAYGMSAGDAVLVAVANRLRETLPAEGLLARLGGDEFTIALLGLHDDAELRRQLSVFNRILQAPFRVLERDIHLSFTLGLGVAPDDTADPEDLLRCASAAMHRGRLENKGQLTRFNAVRDVEFAEVKSMEGELREALRENQFEVHYQPQVTPDLARLTGFEALLRWRHPERGLVSPNRFIPIAEESGLIDELFPYVLDRVCAQYAAWQHDGLSPPPVSVNISPVQMHADNRIAQEVIRCLGRHAVPPTCLKLEITEGTLLRNFEVGTALLSALAEHGIGVVLDDFGVGYSSLGYLAQLPVRSIKIDRTFVQGLEQNLNAAKVLRAVITLAHSLDMDVTVEGVETETQLDAIRQWECHGIQGFIFSRPLAAADATELLKKMSRR